MSFLGRLIKGSLLTSRIFGSYGWGIPVHIKIARDLTVKSSTVAIDGVLHPEREDSLGERFIRMIDERPQSVFAAHKSRQTLDDLR